MLQSGFILHHRPYRETSAILEILTPEGRISVVMRGARKRLFPRALLQPFVPVFLSWRGQSELKNLISIEMQSTPFYLKNNSLLSGLYLNELLVLLLPKEDPCPGLFKVYQDTLFALSEGTLQEKTLRFFEKNLLIELGHGLPLERDINGEALLAEAHYQFLYEEGFQKTIQGPSKGHVFKGASLLNLAADYLEDEETLRDIKYLMRRALGYLLEGKILHSRRLFF